MKTLYLSLKSQWYLMYESGEKQEEYREIKAYWVTRLFENSDGSAISKEMADLYAAHPALLSLRWGQGVVKCKDYTHVHLSYGYTKRAMIFEITNIGMGIGNPAWGAPPNGVFIISVNNNNKRL